MDIMYEIPIIKEGLVGLNPTGGFHLLKNLNLWLQQHTNKVSVNIQFEYSLTGFYYPIIHTSDKNEAILIKLTWC